MTSEEAAFLAAIAASPGDDLPRLVFADWLEERYDERHLWVRDGELFSWMGPNAVSPIPPLLDALDVALNRSPDEMLQEDELPFENPIRFEVGDVVWLRDLLIRTGPSAVDPVLERIERQHWPEHVWAIAGHYPGALMGHVPALSRLAASVVPDIAFAAQRLLVRAAEVEASLLDSILMDVWRMGDPATERALASLAVARGTVAEAVASSWLTHLQSDLAVAEPDDPEFLLAKLTCLADAAEPSPTVLPLFRTALTHPRSELAQVAARGLSRLKDGVGSHLLEAIRACTDDNRHDLMEHVRVAWPEWEKGVLDDLASSTLTTADRLGLLRVVMFCPLASWERVAVALKAALRHPEVEVRLGAVKALQWTDCPTGGALTMLREAANDGSADVRRYVLAAFVEVDRPTPVHVAAISAGLGDTDEDVVSYAQELAQERGLQEEIILDAFRRLDTTSTEHRVRATKTLAMCCDWDDRVLPKLLDLVSDPELDVRRAAIHAVADALNPDAKGVYRKLRKALADPDALVRQGAARAFGRLGPRAAEEAPALLDLSRDSVPIARGGAFYALARIDSDEDEDDEIWKAVRRGLRDESDRAVQCTLDGLYYLTTVYGPKMLKCLLALTEHKQATIRTSAYRVLASFDEEELDDEVFEVFRRGLRDPIPAVAEAALECIDHEHPRITDAIGDLFALYLTPTCSFRVMIEHVLVETPKAYPRFVRLLADEDGERRLWALRFLRRICEEKPDERAKLAPGVLLHLPRLLTQERGERLEATLTLTALLGAAAAPALPQVQPLLDHPNRSIRAAALSAVGELGPTARSLAPALLRILQTSGDPVERGAVAAALIGFGAADPALLTPVWEHFHTDVDSVRIRIAQACGSHPELATRSVPELMRGLAEATEAPPVRAAIATALGKQGRAFRPCATTFCEAMERERDYDPIVAMLGALAELGPDAEGSVPSLIRLRAAAEDDSVHALILRALEKVPGPGRARAVACALTDSSEHVRGIASLVLVELGDETAEAIPVICRALLKLESNDIIHRSIHETNDEVDIGDSEHDVLDLELDFRVELIEILTKLGPFASPAVPTLEELLDDNHPDVRKTAAEALVAVGRTGRPALKKALRHSDPEVREIAEEALG